MPTYEYSCPHCGIEVEIFHSITELHMEHGCPSCGDYMKRLPVAVSLIGGKTLEQMKRAEIGKKRSDTKNNLIDKYDVHEVTPLRKGQTFDDVVKEIKDGGSFVKDQMQETRAKSQEKTAKKQKEWLANSAKACKGLPKK